MPLERRLEHLLLVSTARKTQKLISSRGISFMSFSQIEELKSLPQAEILEIKAQIEALKSKLTGIKRVLIR